MSHDHSEHDYSRHDHDNHGLNINNGSMSGMDMHMHMAMSYHFGTFETILFSWWSIKTAEGLSLYISCSNLLVLICFIYEGIKWARVCWKKKTYEAVALSEHPAMPLSRKLTSSMFGDTALHALQLTLGYSLMLVFMTFNIWLCAAVVLGEAIAHLVFRFMYPDLEHYVEFKGAFEKTCCG